MYRSRDKQPREIFIGRRAQEGGYPRVHLVYPNAYHVGMSSLALQALYAAFVETGCVVERVFMPDDGRWRTFESSRSLSDCDLIAVTVSFEGDYLAVLKALDAEGLVNSDGPRPLLLAGGAAVTLNPEPLAPFFDIFCIGEAEEFVPELVDRLRDGSSDVRSLCEIAGAYAPQFVAVRYDGPAIQEFQYLDRVVQPRRRYVKDLSRFPTASHILTDQTEFASMFMLETGRGCENGCKFCAAGYLYRPIRKQKAEVLARLVSQGLTFSQKLGLVGAAVSSHPALLDLCRAAADAGARASLSSLMAYRMTPELGEQMGRMGIKSVAIAPEAGSERLRYYIGKRVADSVFVDAARELSKRGTTELKLYFMIGLPTEADEDVDAIVELAETMSRFSPSATYSLSVAPFVPKPATPFQWKAMADAGVIDARLKRIKQGIRSNRALRLTSESVRESQYQALLSRGDRRLGALMLEMVRRGGTWKDVLRGAKASIPSLDWIVHREWGVAERLPWDVIDSGVSKELLIREADRVRSR